MWQMSFCSDNRPITLDDVCRIQTTVNWLFRIDALDSQIKNNVTTYNMFCRANFPTPEAILRFSGFFVLIFAVFLPDFYIFL